MGKPSPGGLQEHNSTTTIQKEPSNGGTKKEIDISQLMQSSHGIARRVLPLLSEHNIPITPTNYRLWYEYFAGGRPELKAVLDQMIKENREFTPDATEALYSRFFSMEAAESHCRIIDAAVERVQAMAVDLIKGLVKSIAATTDYSDMLDQQIRDLEAAQDLLAVREIVNGIISKTEGVVSSQKEFRQQMELTREELSELQEELRRREELAHTDDLTSLPNRRAFNIRLDEEWNRARRYGNALSMIMLDLDDFKLVNDTHGHLVGDRLLARTAGAIRSICRQTDLPARYGGEEFAVICPETDGQAAVVVAERIRAAIDATDFTVKGTSIKVTVSVGVAMLRFGETQEILVDRADQGLYRAKQTGKNKVCFQTPHRGPATKA